MALERLTKPRYRPPIKPCARCGGKREPGQRRPLHILGSKQPKSVAMCPPCQDYCPQATSGPEALVKRQCQRKTGHVSLCINAQRKSWKRGDERICQQGEILFPA